MTLKRSGILPTVHTSSAQRFMCARGRRRRELEQVEIARGGLDATGDRDGHPVSAPEFAVVQDKQNFAKEGVGGVRV